MIAVEGDTFFYKEIKAFLLNIDEIDNVIY